MSDENDKAAAEAAAKAEAEKKAAEDAAAKAEAEKQKMVPHEALHAEREKRKTAEAELEKLRKDAADKEAADAAQKGEFKTLYEKEKAAREAAENSLKEKDGRIATFEAKAQASIEKMLGQVKKPEDRKTVEELLDGKSLEQKETLLPTLLEKFGVSANINGSPSGTGEDKNQTDAMIDKEIAELEKQKEEAKKSKDTTKLFEINRKIRELTAKRGA